MANWVLRSPQGVNCAFNPQAPECANPSGIGATTVAAESDGFTGESVQATARATETIASAAVVTSAWTSVFTNDDGSSYTRISADIITEAVPTTSIFTSPVRTTSPATITDPPEAQSAGQSSNNGGVSKGAVAGIAIGTCIVGAAIAFIVAWLLFKRRDKKFIEKTCPSGYPIYADSSPELVKVQKSAANGSPYVQVSQTQMRTPIPIPARVAVASPQAVNDALTGILPPAASEHDVGIRISAVFAEIKRHVDTYYRDVHASITPSMDSDLSSFGKDIDMLELLQSCSHPTVALKHALAAFILTITAPRQGGDEQTLWPSELTHFIKSQDSDSTQLAMAQALHRRLTVHIYTQKNAISPTNRSQSRLSNLSALSLTRKTSSAIREAAENFSLTFFPWANPTFGDQEREGDLAGIMTEALETRIWLAGQTGEWDFEWGFLGRGLIVVSPSLVVREYGRGPRRVVMDQNVVGV
ncbi:hypothetical protein E8E12_011237 [Didymella heteroderae]|uniref:Uncharacterized protein n=1 Tax=Didymella heteroderae TaxID=1769908 RepID=A0A9P4WZ52_9PLEO|nr:hypothetical protein E8E12_011237 [Didymella heteroderae]